MTGTALAERLQLNQNERLLVMLYYAERCTIAECAAVLGMTAFEAEKLRRSIAARARAIVDPQ